MKKPILIIVLCLSFALGLTVYYFLFTQRGSKFIAQEVFNDLEISATKSVETIEGIVLRKMVFKNVEFKDLENLPPGNILRIQELEINMRSLHKEDADIRVENARLMLPHSEPILIEGTYLNKSLRFTIYSKSIHLAEVFQTIELLKAPKANWMHLLTGTVVDLDLKVEGTINHLNIQGVLTAERCKYKDIVLSDAPLTVALDVKDIQSTLQLFGKTSFQKGLLKVKKTAIHFDSSEIVFSGNPVVPVFNLDGSSKIGAVDIRLRLKGTLDKPEYNLYSIPPYPQDLLLVMLATGKEWKGVTTSVDQNALSTDLFTDFIDYFIFEGRGEEMSQRAGLKDIQIELDRNKRGIAVSKDIANNLEVSYGVDQMQDSPTEKTTSQKLGGKVKVTDTISVGLERELKEKVTPEENTALTPNDKVMMEYKRKF